MKKIITFGCRLNTLESELIRQRLDESGADDIVVFNTCSVTHEAERQARQAIRKYSRENPEVKIIVTGCGAQANPQNYADIAGVAKVLGNEEKFTAENYQLENNTKILVGDIAAISKASNPMISGIDGCTRAFLQVQNGCNRYCTFCIVPSTRGPSRSFSADEIIAQARILVDNGYKEIVITGVNITDYSPALSEITERILKEVPDLPRLRFSSLDIAGIDERLINIIADEPRIMPHLHLSLQSGDNMILKRMKRRHSREDTLKFCNRLRNLRQDIVFGADFITGFPTESEQMFENTVNLVENAGITYLHVFPYSERDGTPAAAIPRNKQVPINIRKERASYLRKIGKLQLADFLKSRIGKTESVIVEKSGVGRTEQFALVELSSNYKDGDIAQVTITKTDGEKLFE